MYALQILGIYLSAMIFLASADFFVLKFSRDLKFSGCQLHGELSNFSSYVLDGMNCNADIIFSQETLSSLSSLAYT